MASETRSGVDTRNESRPWTSGAIAGLVAGVVMGLLLTVVMRPVIAVAIPSLYGLQGLASGWVAHLFHGVVFGTGFAAITTRAPLEGSADSLVGAVGTGVAYGVVVWVVAAAVVMPVWLGAVGFPNAPPLPNVDPQSFVGHVVYGAVLGATFDAVR